MVDDAEAGAGSYFEGGWAEDSHLEEKVKDMGEVELGGADGGKYEVGKADQ